MRETLCICILSLFLLAGCGEVRHRVFIDSIPQGAQVLDRQGRLLGLTTPTYVELPIDIESHLVKLSLPGYREATTYFRRDTSTEFMSAQEVVGSIVCSPFCCGLPLLNLLDPVDIKRKLVPERTQINMERTGGGVHLKVFPPIAELIVDGANRGQLLSDKEKFIKLEAGEHLLEFQAPGFEKDVSIDKVLTDFETEVRLNVRLEPVSSLVYVKKSKANLLRRVVIRKQGEQQAEVAPLVDKAVEEKEWFFHQLPPGHYTLNAYGETTSQHDLFHTQSFTVAPNRLTTVDCNEFPDWRKVSPWLGISYRENAQIKLDGRMTFSAHLQVSEVFPNSPAFQAGIQSGDILLAINGHSLSRSRGFGMEPVASGRIQDFLKKYEYGIPLILDVRRGDERLHFKIESLGTYLN